MRYNKKICGGKRIESIDVCKAIGIILVVLGHTNNIPYNLYIAIFSFHMPFFFILSGYVYSREKNEAISFGKYAAKKFRQYMVPYFVFGFIDFAVDIVWRLTLSKQVVDWEYVLRSLRGILLCDLNLPLMCGPIWFFAVPFPFESFVSSDIKSEGEDPVCAHACDGAAAFHLGNMAVACIPGRF